MSVTLGCRDIKVEDNTVKVNVPENDLAKLMYYLSCVSNAINYNEANKYTDYQRYYLLSQNEKKEVYALAILLNPELLIKEKIFIISPMLLTRGLNNQFYKITDDTIGVHANQEIAIGGRVVQVLEIMVCNERWLSDNYYKPLTNIINENNYNSSDKVNYGSFNSSSTKNCCKKRCIIVSIIIVAIFLIIFLVDKFALKGKIFKSSENK